MIWGLAQVQIAIARDVTIRVRDVFCFPAVSCVGQSPISHAPLPDGNAGPSDFLSEQTRMRMEG